MINVEYTFDNSKIVFYFTAEGRVDFRDLVKDLASVFKTRIELRQIGVRDETKMLGAWGPVGGQPAAQSFWGFSAGFHQDGKGAEPFALADKNQRPLRPAHVLPGV